MQQLYGKAVTTDSQMHVSTNDVVVVFTHRYSPKNKPQPTIRGSPSEHLTKQKVHSITTLQQRVHSQPHHAA